jgi:hypothetical protein
MPDLPYFADLDPADQLRLVACIGRRRTLPRAMRQVLHELADRLEGVPSPNRVDAEAHVHQDRQRLCRAFASSEQIDE